MKVLLTTDGRVFDGEATTFEPGDVAWFEEDILLVTKIEDGVAQAIVHPAAVEMLRTALNHGKSAREGFDAAYKIHHRAMAKGYLAALAFAQSLHPVLAHEVAPGREQVVADKTAVDALRVLHLAAEKAQELVR